MQVSPTEVMIFACRFSPWCNCQSEFTKAPLCLTHLFLRAFGVYTSQYAGIDALKAQLTHFNTCTCEGIFFKDAAKPTVSPTNLCDEQQQREIRHTESVHHHAKRPHITASNPHNLTHFAVAGTEA